LADALSRPEDSPEFHREESRMQVFIKSEYLDFQIWTEASIAAVIPVAPEPDVPVINRILALN
jgi:hypothetical protein